LSIANGLCTLEQAKSALNIQDAADNTLVELAVGAASRSIENYVGHRFFIDAAVTVRQFNADDTSSLTIPEGIATATGLIVQTDAAGDGTFETTLTINTDFVLEPVNSLVLYPARPYTEIRLLTGSFPQPANGQPGVKVTAKFGWPAIPDDVTLACILLAKDLVKAKDAPFGVAGTSDFGVLRIRQNATVIALLQPYRPAFLA
jgi:hypothetical protein